METIQEKLERIPTDTDILITHFPPHSILDSIDNGEHHGVEELKEIVLNEIQPLFHIFGHAHEAYGTKKIDNTTFINASVMSNK